jgi:uncharacterized protein YegJ (DUF2314 family)
MNEYWPDLRRVLRRRSPLDALTLDAGDPITLAPDDDPRMKAAAAEAQRRWDEFAQAFKNRRPRQGFAVKVAFHDGASTEFMWVEVATIEGGTIRGNLSNDPQMVKNVRSGDAATVKRRDVTDWIYSDGAEMVGGFQTKVLQQIERESATRPAR